MVSLLWGNKYTGPLNKPELIHLKVVSGFSHRERRDWLLKTSVNTLGGGYK